jgi:hypothetical protein
MTVSNLSVGCIRKEYMYLRLNWEEININVTVLAKLYGYELEPLDKEVNTTYTGGEGGTMFTFGWRVRDRRKKDNGNKEKSSNN